ncbi:MAG: sigma-70 family RNA polymerase sigma factor [Phycisphaerae bacterium]
MPARAPAPAKLTRLCAADRQRLDRILAQPVAYMDHPSFSDPKTAAVLFPEAFGDRSRAPWCRSADAEAKPRVDCQMSSPTLNREEEQTLFLRLNYSRHRMAALLRSFAGRRLTVRAARELLWWHARCERTRCEIVQANMPLVLAMAKRTKLGNIDYAELISEGNMALLRSVDKFDCGRGFKFSTYACRAILKSFSRVAMKLARYRGRFPVEFDPSLERSDYLEHQRLDHEADCVAELRGIMQSNAASLNEVEVKVIRARFALGGFDGLDAAGPKTLEQVGLLIGVTKERVRQIQNRALAKLRDKLLDDFLAA